jgi:polysaccharide pyruvyl transferase WcaK-like protein
MDIEERKITRLHTILSIFKKNRKLEVLLLGAYGSGNVGDLAILDAMIEDLDSDKDILYSVASRDQFLKKNYDVDLINPFSITGFLQCLRKEVMIIGGGGLFGHETHSHIKMMMPFIIIAKILGKKLVFYDVGIYRAEKKSMLRILWLTMRKADAIILREDTDIDIIPKDILQKTKIEPDITFSLSPKEPKDEKVSEFLRSPTGVVGLSLRFVNLKNLYNDYDDRIAKATKQVILEEFLQKNIPVLFMPFQDFDTIYIRHYFGDIIDKYRDTFLILETNKYTINEIKWIVSRLRLTVGMRLHFQIFSNDLGTPVIGISYAPKNTNYLMKVKAPMINAYTINTEELRNAVSIASRKNKSF